MVPTIVSHLRNINVPNRGNGPTASDRSTVGRTVDGRCAASTCVRPAAASVTCVLLGRACCRDVRAAAKCVPRRPFVRGAVTCALRRPFVLAAVTCMLRRPFVRAAVTCVRAAVTCMLRRPFGRAAASAVRASFCCPCRVQDVRACCCLVQAVRASCCVCGSPCRCLCRVQAVRPSAACACVQQRRPCARACRCVGRPFVPPSAKRQVLSAKC